jgi:cobalamin biosynthesis protein CobT
MKKGIIRRRGSPDEIGRWRADLRSLVVETEDAELRGAADEILKTPQSIPVHAAERHAGLSYSEDVVESPAKLKYLALFALEMEERGFEVEPDEEDDDNDDEDEDEGEYADDGNENNNGNDDGNSGD